MNYLKKLMGLALLLSTTITYNLCSYDSITFNNNLTVKVTLKGPRGSKSLGPRGFGSIHPIFDPVKYSISAQGYTTYQGSASAGATYNINVDKNNNITVTEQQPNK